MLLDNKLNKCPFTLEDCTICPEFATTIVRRELNEVIPGSTITELVLKYLVASTWLNSGSYPFEFRIDPRIGSSPLQNEVETIKTNSSVARVSQERFQQAAAMEQEQSVADLTHELQKWVTDVRMKPLREGGLVESGTYNWRRMHCAPLNPPAQKPDASSSSDEDDADLKRGMDELAAMTLQDATDKNNAENNRD